MVLRDHCRICSDRLIPPYSIALFRLIRFTLKLRRCSQKPHGSSTVSARINHAKSFQMKKIVPQGTMGNRRIDLCADKAAIGAVLAVGAQRRALTGSDRLCHKAA
jgi:hypothetical protein